MNIADVNIPVSPLRACIDDIVAHLKRLEDQSGNLIYGVNVKNEREDPRTFPTAEESPYVRVCLAPSVSAENHTVDMYAARQTATAEIYIYGFHPEPELQLGFSQKMEDLVYWTLLAFSSPHLDEPAFPTGMEFKTAGWRNWDIPQFILTGPQTPLDVNGRSVEVPTGWIVRCIRLKFWTAGEIRPVDQIAN